jgi:hypothetical protein
VWKLARPSIAEVDVELNAALGSKAAGHAESPTEDEKRALWELYQAYESGGGRPHDSYKGKGMRAEFLQLIHDGYKQVQDNGRLATLRSAIKLGASECPYCGFGPIEDLDHHLQKGIYKLLSIFPLNLVPACATCNRGKPRAPDPSGSRQLFNVYLEDCTGNTFFVVRAAIDPVSGGLMLKFCIEKATGMSQEVFERLQHHLEIFRLQERLLHQANLYLGNFEVPLADQFRFGGAASVKDFLERCSAANAKRHGLNDWRTALMTGLAECEEFCAGGFLNALGYPNSQ